jgi:hypothetical protein
MVNLPITATHEVFAPIDNKSPNILGGIAEKYTDFVREVRIRKSGFQI